MNDYSLRLSVMRAIKNTNDVVSLKPLWDYLVQGASTAHLNIVQEFERFEMLVKRSCRYSHGNDVAADLLRAAHRASMEDRLRAYNEALVLVWCFADAMAESASDAGLRREWSRVSHDSLVARIGCPAEPISVAPRKPSFGGARFRAEDPATIGG